MIDEQGREQDFATQYYKFNFKKIVFLGQRSSLIFIENITRLRGFYVTNP